MRYRKSSRVGDAFGFGLNRFDRVGCRQPQAEAGLDQGNLDLGITEVGNADFRGLGARRQIVPQLPCDHRHQALVMPRVGIVVPHGAQLSNPLRAVERIDEMPGRQIEVDRAGHLARWQAAAAGADRTESEFGQDRLELDALIKVGAGNVHTMVGEDVGAATQQFAPPWPDAQH